MSEIFKICYVQGLVWGFTVGFIAFFAGYAINKAFSLFELAFTDR